MYVEQFYLASLGHASYLVGDEATGKALVLDPRRDVDAYLGAARSLGMRIAYAMDTHGHNDYLSGLSELAARTDVELLGAVDAGLGYDHRPLKDGEVVDLGHVAVEVMHTPGHTPEHASVLVRDLAVGDDPALLLSGGALLVGDVARPDLLGGAEETRAAARAFCRTLQERILPLPDHVAVLPTHVAGSLCGGSIGSRLWTTLGYERATNPILRRAARCAIDDPACIPLENLPAVPPYWRRMRAQNLAGPRTLGTLREPPALQPGDFGAAAGRDAVVLDARAPEAFGGGHVPGAVNVALGTSFATWAGTVLPDHGGVLLVLDRPGDLWEATWQLLRIGYDPPVGWLAGGMHGWRTSGRPLASLPQLSVHELRERLLHDRTIAVLDVRQPAEWAAGHVEGATFITGAELPQRIADVPEAETLAVVCGSGFRSSVAASLLAAHGRRHVVNVLGGMGAWTAAGYPTTAPARRRTR